MATISRFIKDYVKSYTTSKGTFFKVVLPDGRGGQIRKQGFLEEQEANRFAVTYYGNLLKGKGLKAENKNIFFREVAQQWIETKNAEKLREATLMRYSDELRFRIVPFFDGFKIDDIEKRHLRHFIQHLQENGSSTATVHYSVSVFRSLMKYAEQVDFTGPKGFSSVKLPKHKVRDPVFWDVSQMKYFINATKGHEKHLLWKLALYTGLRAGELAGLKWSSIELEKSFGGSVGYLKVERSFNQKTGLVQETTKNGESRVVPLLPEAREALVELFRNRSGEFVFGGEEPVCTSHYSRWLKAELRKHPLLPELTFHSLRHTFCSYLEAKGIPRRIVADVMGHLDINTTSKYSHVNLHAIGEAFLSLEERGSKQKSNNFRVVNI